VSKPQHLIIPPELEKEMTPAVKAFVRVLFGRIEDLEGKVQELEAKVEKLTKRDPKLTPDNSSLPPSSQHPHAKSKGAKAKASQKQAGAQPGHTKHDRDLIPSDQVLVLKPQTCRKCGQELKGVDLDPLRHQVWELPEIRAEVKEYQRHRLGCSCCGTQACASLPPGIPQGQSGPRLIAFAGLLMGYYRQSKRRTALFLQDFQKTVFRGIDRQDALPSSPSLGSALRGTQSPTWGAEPGLYGRNTHQAGKGKGMAMDGGGSDLCSIRDISKLKSRGTGQAFRR
jgi:hypothetical protein